MKERCADSPRTRPPAPEEELRLEIFAPGILAGEARPEDEPAMRALLRRRPMEGLIRVALTREPDFRIAAAVEGKRHSTFVLREVSGPDGTTPGRLLGFGSRSVRRVYYQGKPVRMGYLNQMRALPGISGIRRLRAGFAHLEASRRRDEAPFDLTTIMADNRPARRLLEKGLRGLPAYRPLCDVETLVFSTTGDHAVGRDRAGAATAVTPLAGGSPDLFFSFLNVELSRRPFAPVWEKDDFSAEGRARDLAVDDVFLAKEDGEVVGCGAIWDQRAYKQTVIQGYKPWLRSLRPLFNVGLRTAGQPLLPPPGTTLAMAFLSCFAVRDDDEGRAFALVEAMRREARRRGLGQLVLSLAREHPLREPLRRRFAARPYRSVLYAVFWPGDPRPSGLLEGTVPYLEAALL